MQKDDRRVNAKSLLGVLSLGIVKGMTETSHSEGGVSDAWDRESIKNNIRSICRNYGFDESEFVEVSTISDGSKYW